MEIFIVGFPKQNEGLKTISEEIEASSVLSSNQGDQNSSSLEILSGKNLSLEPLQQVPVSNAKNKTIEVSSLFLFGNLEISICFILSFFKVDLFYLFHHDLLKKAHTCVYFYRFRLPHDPSTWGQEG